MTMNQTGYVLRGAVRVACVIDSEAVSMAAADLVSDCQRVLGVAAVAAPTGPADIRLGIDAGELTAPETWRIDVRQDEVHIDGADELGLIFGIYEFSRRYLGVDPLWYWKDIEPVRRDRLEIPLQTITATPPVFRYRGWFINDEDLLSEFQSTGGKRDIDYPFYAQVANHDLLERVFEALLRLGGNLIIPASFLDVTNPAEAEIAQRAARRGLYVSQHHIEPLGVSHFGFENFWRRRGQECRFLYSTEPWRLREAWTEFGQRWRDAAGDRVVWQLGLRGRGDRPVWTADSGITRDTGAAYISQAMREQMDIVAAVDPRATPPATTTLFMEGAQLMAEGKLQFPEGLTIVFSDEGFSQQLQEDFHICPRLKGHTYGVYYHTAFWRCGPHLIQGVIPADIQAMFGLLEAKGDTHYAIANVSNLREHVLGAHTFIRTAWHGARRPLEETLDEFGPRELRPLMDGFHAAMVRRRDGAILQDGDCNQAVDHYITAPVGRGGRPALPEWTDAVSLQRAAEALEEVAERAGAVDLDARWRAFAQGYFGAQGRSLAALYRALALLLTPQGPDLRGAADEIEASIAARQPLAQGKWANWYRGDRKCHWPVMVEQLRARKG